MTAGESYERLQPVLGVHFLDYVLFADTRRGGHVFELRERHDPRLRLTDQLALFLFEMPKAAGFAETDQSQASHKLRQWLQFFNNAPNETEASMREHYTHPPIHQAFEALERLSADEKTRQMAEMREKALRDEIDLLAYARREGREEGRKEGRQEERQFLAMSLLNDGESLERTAKLSRLSLDEVRDLQQAMQHDPE